MADNSNQGGDSNQGGFDAPLDELFVERAAYKEPSAAERAAWAKAARGASRRRRRRSRAAGRTARLQKSTPLLVLGGITILAYFLWPGGGGGSRPVNVDAFPDHVRAVYAPPSDVTVDDEMIAAIRNEVGLVDAWFVEESGGTGLGWVEDSSGFIVDTRPLAVTTTELRDRSDAVGLVIDEFRDDDGRLPADELLLVFVPVQFENQVRCGEGSASGLAVVWVGSCGLDPSSSSTVFGDGATVVAAHEIVHAMGAVEACAPNYGRNGHVIDDIADLMYDPPDSSVAVELDPGRDDYFAHDNDGCWDIKDHPLWD